MENNMNPAEELKNQIDSAIESKATETADAVKSEMSETINKHVEELKNENALLQKQIDEVKMEGKGSFGIGKKRTELQEKFAQAKSDYFAKGNATLELDMKTFTAGSGPAGQIYMDERVGDIKYDPNYANRLRNVLNTGTTSGGSVRYNQETTNTPNAGSKAKGSAQTAAVKTITDRQVQIQTLSIFHTVPEEWLDDTQMLESYFSTRFMGDLMDAEDLNILNGNPGAGAAGSLTAATAFEGINSNGRTFADNSARATYAGSIAGLFSSSDASNYYDALSAVKAGLENDNFMPDCVILNPIDATHISLLKSTAGEYILQQVVTPAGSVEYFFMGMKVVKTPAQTSGTFTVLDTKATQYWMREGLSIQFQHNANDFQTNSISIKGIVRGNVTNYLPNGIVSGTFTEWTDALDL